MRPICAVLLLALAGAALSQVPTPAEALRASPKAISIEDLPASYRAVTLDTGSAVPQLSAWGLGSGATRGSTLLGQALTSVWVDPDEWAAVLDGRIPRIRGFEIETTLLLEAAKQPLPARQPLFHEVWIERGAIGGWAPVPALAGDGLIQAMTPFQRARPASDQTAALSAVKQLSTSVLIYLSDADDIYPRANSTAEVQPKLNPYIKNDSLWQTANPAGGRILYNVALSGQSATADDEPQKTILIWEEHPWSDGRRAVAFADGHAKRLDEAEWDAAWKRELARRAALRKPRRIG